MDRPSRKSGYKRLSRLSDGPYPAYAIRYGRRFLMKYPDHGAAWYQVGKALLRLARHEEAEQALAKAIELCPEGHLQIPFAAMGELFKFSGDYERAEHWYRRAIDAAPDDTQGYIYLGGMLARLGRLIEAEEVHRQGIQCSRGYIDEAYLNLGLVLRARERFSEAAECFREAIRLDPEYRAAKQALRDVEHCLKFGRRRG
jgi:tetratricopeptide (TPR) repeat protein